MKTKLFDAADYLNDDMSQAAAILEAYSTKHQGLIDNALAAVQRARARKGGRNPD